MAGRGGRGRGGRLRRGGPHASGDWAAHRRARRSAREPLVPPGTATTPRPARRLGRPRRRRRRAARRSACGVFDLTRAHRGPGSAAHAGGARREILRLDAPDLPELPLSVLDTGAGKRSALLDLRSPAGRATVEELLAGGDVLVQGYRPGALAAFGLDPRDVRERHPHLATVTLAAWGHTGPWRARRGFDSLVQAATGIAELTRDVAADHPARCPPRRWTTARGT